MKSRHIAHRVCRVFEYAVLAALACGCNRQPSVATDSGPARNAESVPAISTDTEIKEGFGIPQCHVGMAVTDIVKSFGNPDRTDTYRGKYSPEDGAMWYRRAGFQITYLHDNVSRVFFSYLSKKDTPFAGRTSRGINSKSSIADVIAAYGKPPDVEKIALLEFGEWPRKLDTKLRYPKLGIDFSFIESDLESIGVFPQESTDE